MDYYQKYIEQSKNKPNTEYIKYIDIYFSNNDNYTREEKDSELILIEIESKKKIILKQPKYINLYEEKLKFEKLKYELLYKIDKSINHSNDSEFNSLKSKLFEINESFRNILRVFKEKKIIIKSIEDKEKDLNHELFKLYLKRNKYFNIFPKNIKTEHFHKLKELYKSEGNSDERRLQIISNELKIKISDVKIILNWFIMSKKYKKAQLILNEEINNNVKQV